MRDTVVYIDDAVKKQSKAVNSKLKTEMALNLNTLSKLNHALHQTSSSQRIHGFSPKLTSISFPSSSPSTLGFVLSFLCHFCFSCLNSQCLFLINSTGFGIQIATQRNKGNEAPLCLSLQRTAAVRHLTGSLFNNESLRFAVVKLKIKNVFFSVFL